MVCQCHANSRQNFQATHPSTRIHYAIAENDEMLEHAIKFDESCETARSAGEIILPTPKLNSAKNIMNDTKIFVFAEHERKFCFTFFNFIFSGHFSM